MIYQHTNIKLNDIQNIPAKTAYIMYKLHPWIASNGGEIESYDVT